MSGGRLAIQLCYKYTNDLFEQFLSGIPDEIFMCDIVFNIEKKAYRALSPLDFVLAIITKNINQSVTVVVKIFWTSGASRSALIGSMESKCSSKILLKVFSSTSKGMYLL